MKGFRRFILLLAITAAIPLTAYGQAALIPVGQAVGLVLGGNTLTVAALEDFQKSKGLQVGDILLEIDGTAVSSPEEISRAMEKAGDRVCLTIRRDGENKTVSLTPQTTAAGKRLGIVLRQGIAGIGTVTWYDPENGEFAALGHGISAPGGGLAACTDGNAFPGKIMSVQRGRCGTPGQLKGTAESQLPLGTLTRNTPQGVFGKADIPFSGESVPVGQPATGKAEILATVSGTTPRSYCVEILKIYPDTRRDGRNLLLKVTDPDLLEQTGGIVQGMSGSPILQNGCLVGAVTHVLINNPAVGYGIAIENMLEAAR